MSESREIKCSPAERMLIEGRKAAADELYRRGDLLLAEAVDASLASHGIERNGASVRMAIRDGSLFLGLQKPPQPEAAPAPKPETEPVAEPEAPAADAQEG